MVEPQPAASVPYEAVILDMDGVVTDTALVHAAAWEDLFTAVLAELAPPGTAPFDAEGDYRRFVDGRSREDGVRTFLTARGIALPEGTPGDGPDELTVHGLAERKNRLFLDLVAEEGVRPFPTTVDLVERLRSGAVATGLVTASRNALAILTGAGAGSLFDTIVDGSDAAELGLAGKPDPAMFLEAARRLGVEPGRAVVVEDAVAGVEAARRGGFGLVVGVDRGAQRDALRAAGADVVVGDVAQLDLGAIRGDPWRLIFEGFDPVHEAHREALCTLGNGYIATRGAAPESHDDGTHYPGTYLAAVYNRLVTRLPDGEVEDEHMVNCPNWLPFDLVIDGGTWWSEGGLTARSDRRELDLRRGLLTRECVLVDPAGRRLTVTQRRMVSMDRPHVMALETRVVPENWTGRLRVCSGLDANVTNDNVAEYRLLEKRHLTVAGMAVEAPGVVVLEADTTQSRVRIAVAARTTIDGEPATTVEPAAGTEGGVVWSEAVVDAREGVAIVVDKTVAVFSSRDRAVADPRQAALAELDRAAAGLAGLLVGHERAWARLWDRFGVAAEVDCATALTFNLHLFHLLQSLSLHSIELDAGVPARGLHGEGYRGHVFWDELFVFPLLTLRLPDLTRSLLLYRWRRLDAARDAARTAGLPGALFPWQSGSDGREETPERLFNTRSGRWMPDHSRLQRHVGLAVAHNVWRYFEATGDLEFLAAYGAELIVEVARFFAALASYDSATDRFDIAGVMGPDEYHDAYPTATVPGLRNNAYTNVLTSWVLARALDVVELLDGDACGSVGPGLRVDRDEVGRWEHVSRRLRVPFHDGVISQFEGYEALEELDWDGYRRRYGNVGRLDLVLEAEGDSTNRYKLSKQADVLMLFYLFSPVELGDQFDRLGYPLEAATITRTTDYYLARTAHGSTLSRMVHSSVLARLDRERSWAVFEEALDADLDDTQGGTTGEGIHLAAMAGTVDLLLRCYGGLATHDDTLWFDPNPPSEVGSTRFDVFYRGQRITVTQSPGHLRLSLCPCSAAAVRVGIGDEVRLLAGGDTWDHPISGLLAG